MADDGSIGLRLEEEKMEMAIQPTWNLLRRFSKAGWGLASLGFLLALPVVG
jgi:hypothetical protein